MSQILVPETVAEACRMLAVPGRIACAGATNLYVDRQKGKYAELDIVSLHRLKELDFIRHEADGWHIGSLTVFHTIENALKDQKAMAALAAAASEVGSPQIRNRGTIGGNILSASPAADTVPVMMALDARLVLEGTGGARTAAINGFMKGPGKTDIQPGEVLTEIFFPEKPGRALFRKVGKRNALAISVVNAAVYLSLNGRTVTDIAIAAGSVGPVALRTSHVEAVLLHRSRPATEAEWQCLHDEIREALLKDITPIDDLRATASYRQQAAGNVIMDLIRRLWEEPL